MFIGILHPGSRNETASTYGASAVLDAGRALGCPADGPAAANLAADGRGPRRQKRYGRTRQVYVGERGYVDRFGADCVASAGAPLSPTLAPCTISVIQFTSNDVYERCEASSDKP